nr:DUF6350 family protein [Actinospica acidithermotolerans]
MAETEQAAAGSAAEPEELGPGRARPPLARLIADQLAQLPPLPETVRALPSRVRRDFAENGSAYLSGVRAAAVVAAGGWLVAASLTLLLWATAAPAGSDPSIPLRVSAELWLAAHHVMLHAPDGPFGLSPLGFTLLPVVGLYAAGQRTARKVPGFAVRASVGAAVGYAACACIIAAGATGDGLTPEYAQVLLYPAGIALAGHAAGAAGSIRELLPRTEAPWLPAAARGTAAALCVYLGAAALLAASLVVTHADAALTAQQQIGAGPAGEAGLFLIDVALVPNAVLWVIGVLAGPGFALGTGTDVSLFSVVRGPLPGLPLLSATPASQQPAMGWLALLLVPAAAGALGALLVGRRAASWPDRITATAAMAAAAGLILAVAEMYAGGPVAFGAMSVVGSTAWLVGALVSAEVLLAAAATFGAWYVAPALAERLRGRDERVVPASSGLDDDRVDDLVGEGLVLGVPERGEVADAELEDVAEVPADGPAEAGDLTVSLPNYPDVHDALADGLAGGALLVGVPEPDGDDVDHAEEQGDDGAAGGAAAGGTGGGVDGDGSEQAADVVGVADPEGDHQGDVVDEPGGEPLPPAGEGA